MQKIIIRNLLSSLPISMYVQYRSLVYDFEVASGISSSFSISMWLLTFPVASNAISSGFGGHSKSLRMTYQLVLRIASGFNRLQVSSANYSPYKTAE